jgi:hypothetical protein
VSTPTSQLAAWERREGTVMAVLPYALLAVVTALTAIIERDDPGRLAVIVALSVVTAAWMLWMRTLHPSGAAARG